MKKVIVMHLQESGEMYLETILILSQKSDAIRGIDIGEYMGYSKPSVSRAIGLLKKGGYVDTNEHGHIVLTEIGRETATKTYERHKFLTKFFTHIGVDEETASKDACKAEHILSDATITAMKNYLNKNE